MFLVQKNNKTTLDIMFDDVLNRKEGCCILENVILTVLKTCILPMELTMILLKIMKFLFSLVIYWKKLNDAFLAGRWPMQMIWRENRIREAMGRKSRRSNQETNPNQVTKRKKRSEQLKPEVRNGINSWFWSKTWLTYVLINSLKFLLSLLFLEKDLHLIIGDFLDENKGTLDYKIFI